jgi:cell division protein FtsZ
MDSTPTNPVSAATDQKPLRLKVFGVGTAGIFVTDRLVSGGIPASTCVAINTDAQALSTSSAAEKLQVETKLLRGLGTGGDPDRGREAAEEHFARLKALSEGTQVLFIVAGLGGGAGTGICPVLARAAKEAGAMVLAFISTPFDCEGNRRQRFAQQGLQELRSTADGVICLANQKAFKLIDENTTVLQAFQFSNELLAEAVRGLWRLVTLPGLIEIHFSEVCELLRDRHTESAFATADAMGATRSRDVVDKLLAHPLLESGQLLSEADAVLVSLTGGPDLTMSEVNRVMEQLNGRCGRAQVLMGAAIDETFRERLAVTLIATRKREELAPEEHTERASSGTPEELDTQLLPRANTARPGSRFVPPPPALPPDQVQQMLAKQRPGGARGRKSTPRLRQTQLPLEIISKGRFDKSEPTIHKGEDLDVPTYIRRGVALN